MRVVIDGAVFNNPTYILVEVDPAGETVGPLLLRFTGGPLTVRSDSEVPALTVTGESTPFLTLGSLSAVRCQDLLPVTPSEIRALRQGPADRLRRIVHDWRENVLEMESDHESYRNREYRELLLGCAQEVEDALKPTTGPCASAHPNLDLAADMVVGRVTVDEVRALRGRVPLQPPSDEPTMVPR